MTRKRAWLIVLALIAAFLLWRLVRPMNIFVVDERFERPMRVDMPRGVASLSAKACGRCHREIYGEWAGSMHGRAWTDPYFQVDSRYDGSQQICLNCHTPLVNQQQGLVLGFRDRDKFDPVLEPTPGYDAALRDEGVTCVGCHVRNGRNIGPYRHDRAPHSVECEPARSRGIKPGVRRHVGTAKQLNQTYSIQPSRTREETAN